MIDELVNLFLHLFVGLLIAAGLVFLVASLALLLFDTESVKKRQLKKQAIQDYKQSRGTAHRYLLEKAAHRFKSEINRYQKQINAAEREKSSLNKKKQEELEQLLAKWLIETRLHEAHGIGEALKWDIMHSVFRGRISDLRRAQFVQGIGEQKQYYINQWIDHYEAQVPTLLKQHFPGKERALSKYRIAVEEQDRQREIAKTKQGLLHKKVKPINQELSWLREIKVRDFVYAYQHPGDGKPEIEEYLTGVFATWEPMPDWFRTEVASEAD